MMCRLLCYLTAMLISLACLEGRAATCPCPLPPFTYCRCCPPPCPVNDSKHADSVNTLVTLCSKQQDYWESISEYLSSNYERYHLSGQVVANQNQWQWINSLLTDKAFPQSLEADAMRDQPTLQTMNHHVRSAFFLSLNPEKTMDDNVSNLYYQQQKNSAYFSKTAQECLASLWFLRDSLGKTIPRKVANPTQSQNHAQTKQPLSLIASPQEEIASQLHQLSNILKAAEAKGASQADRKNSLGDMLALQKEVKRSLERSLLVTQVMLNEWLKVAAVTTLSQEITPSSKLGELPLESGHDSQKTQQALIKLHQCQQQCEQKMVRLQKMQWLLTQALNIHQDRYAIAQWGKLEQEVVKVINQHKRLVAQGRDAANHVKILLGTMFIDQEAAFQKYSTALLTNQGAFYDATEFIDHMLHYQESLSKSEAIFDDMLRLAETPSAATRSLPLEEIYGPLKPSMKECVSRRTGAVMFSELCFGQDREYRVHYHLRKVLKGDNPHILYPPDILEMTMHPLNTLPEVNFASDQRDLFQKEASWLSQSGNYIALKLPELWEMTVLAPERKTLLTMHYPNLPNATAFLLESLKEERFYWLFRYGANVPLAVQWFGRESTTRYENNPPAWYASYYRPWWEMRAWDEIADSPKPMLREMFMYPKEAPSDAPVPERFYAPQGAEGTAYFIQQWKKWLGEKNFQKIDGLLSAEEKAKFGWVASVIQAQEKEIYQTLSQVMPPLYQRSMNSKEILPTQLTLEFPNLVAYLRTAEGIAHLEFIFLQEFDKERIAMAAEQALTEKQLSQNDCFCTQELQRQYQQLLPQFTSLTHAFFYHPDGMLEIPFSWQNVISAPAESIF